MNNIFKHLYSFTWKRSEAATQLFLYWLEWSSVFCQLCGHFLWVDGVRWGEWRYILGWWGGLTFLWVSGGKGRYILVVRGCVSIFYGWVRVSDGRWKYILGECTWVAVFLGWVGVVTCFIITSLKSVEKLFVSDFDSDDNWSFAFHLFHSYSYQSILSKQKHSIWVLEKNKQLFCS